MGKKATVRLARRCKRGKKRLARRCKRGVIIGKAKIPMQAMLHCNDTQFRYPTVSEQEGRRVDKIWAKRQPGW